MSDANILVLRREPELSEHDEAGIMAAAVELGCFHWVEQSNRVLVAATKEVHRLTLLLEEKDETILALNALAAKLEAVIAVLGGRKPELRVVGDEWMGRRFDSETTK